MKSKLETQKIIKNAVDVATVLGIEAVVMDKFSLRGENKELGVVIIMPTSDIDLEIDAIGLGNIGALKNRMSMLNDANITYQLMDKYDDEKIVGQIKLSQGRTNISYKCSDPKMIRAPKIINNPTRYKLHLKEEDVQTVIKGIGTMASEYVTFVTEEGKSFFKISDNQGDLFSHELDASIDYIEDDGVELTKTYKAKTLRTIFTNYIRKDDATLLPVEVTSRGIMKLLVLGMTIYLFPER